jgi:hypothetical protein
MKCPKCGNTKVGKLVFGLIRGEFDAKTKKKMVEGKLIFAGCCVRTDENGNWLEWHCHKCNHEW